LAVFILSRFHIITHSSFDPDAKRFPLLLTATLRIQSECPLTVYKQYPESVSHNLIVWSLEHDTKIFPPGKKSSEDTSCS
jgi:hypothetical protein